MKQYIFIFILMTLVLASGCTSPTPATLITTETSAMNCQGIAGQTNLVCAYTFSGRCDILMQFLYVQLPYTFKQLEGYTPSQPIFNDISSGKAYIEHYSVPGSCYNLPSSSCQPSLRQDGTGDCLNFQSSGTVVGKVTFTLPVIPPVEPSPQPEQPPAPPAGEPPTPPAGPGDNFITSFINAFIGAIQQIINMLTGK